MSKTPKCLTILAQLPDEFHASDYKALAGTTYSGASGFIAHLTKKGHIERIAYGRYRKLNGANSPSGRRDQLAAATLQNGFDAVTPALSAEIAQVSSLFDDIAAVLAENNRLREENSTLRAAIVKLREESTWLTAEINRWADIARAAKQIPLGRTACEH